MITGFDHTSFTVTDMEKSVKFWTEQLGFEAASVSPRQGKWQEEVTGIAGASVGYFLSAHTRVLVLEREPQPGLHSTGRSAALFSETYGPPQVRALTRASRGFFASPPPGFVEHELLGARGVLVFGNTAQRAQIESDFDSMRARVSGLQILDSARMRASRSLDSMVAWTTRESGPRFL